MNNSERKIIPVKTKLFLQAYCPYCKEIITIPSNYQGSAILCGNTGCRRIIMLKREESESKTSKTKIA